MLIIWNKPGLNYNPLKNITVLLLDEIAGGFVYNVDLKSLYTTIQTFFNFAKLYSPFCDTLTVMNCEKT